MPGEDPPRHYNEVVRSSPRSAPSSPTPPRPAATPPPRPSRPRRSRDETAAEHQSRLEYEADLQPEVELSQEFQNLGTTSQPSSQGSANSREDSHQHRQHSSEDRRKRQPRGQGRGHEYEKAVRRRKATHSSRESRDRTADDHLYRPRTEPRGRDTSRGRGPHRSNSRGRRPRASSKARARTDGYHSSDAVDAGRGRYSSSSRGRSCSTDLRRRLDERDRRARIRVDDRLQKAKERRDFNAQVQPRRTDHEPRQLEDYGLPRGHSRPEYTPLIRISEGTYQCTVQDVTLTLQFPLQPRRGYY
jgi:hypothetical protein